MSNQPWSRQPTITAVAGAVAIMTREWGYELTPSRCTAIAKRYKADVNLDNAAALRDWVRDNVDYWA